MTGTPTDHQLHNSQGGLREMTNAGPWTYARQLAKYLPADTARVRTIEMYGHAPTIEYIEGQRAAHLAGRESFRQASENLRHVPDGGRSSYRLESLFGAEFQGRAEDMRTGCAALQAAIERERKP